MLSQHHFPSPARANERIRNTLDTSPRAANKQIQSTFTKSQSAKRIQQQSINRRSTAPRRQAPRDHQHTPPRRSRSFVCSSNKCRSYPRRAYRSLARERPPLNYDNGGRRSGVSRCNLPYVETKVNIWPMKSSSDRVKARPK